MAVQARGYKGLLTVDYEKDFGKANKTKAGYRLPFNENSVEQKQTLIDAATITGTRNDVQPAMGRKDVSGALVVPMDYDAFGFWLKAILGEPQTSGDGAKTHVFTVGDDQPSFTIEKAMPDVKKYFQYLGCKVNTLGIEFGQDSEMTANVEVLGAERIISDNAYNESAPAIPLNRINQFHADIKINGKQSRIVREGSIELAAGLDGDQYVVGGGGVRGDIPEGLFKASGNISALFNDLEMMKWADEGTAVSMEIIFTHKDCSLSFLFPTVQIEPTDAPIKGSAGVTLDAKWRAYSADASTSLVTVTLKNKQAKY